MYNFTLIISQLMLMRLGNIYWNVYRFLKPFPVQCKVIAVFLDL